MAAFLRQHSADPEATLRRIDADLTALSDTPTDDIRGRILLLGRAGEGYRMLARYDDSARLITQAVALARAHDEPALLIANLIRLATTQQYAGRHHAALATFREALTLTGIGPHRADWQTAYEDFALQHMGKCLAEMDHLDQAIACFEAALTLRERKNDAGLIASTREALDAAWALHTAERT